MTIKTHYVTCWRLEQREFFLLWADGGAKPDEYVVATPGTLKLLVAPTRKQIEAMAHKRHLLVSVQSTDTIDLDAANAALLGLRPSRDISLNGAKALLNAWNTFEDVARSIRVDLMAIKSSDKKLMDHLYEKIFYGNNLPSVTPEGKIYTPMLENEERRLLRLAFRAAMQKLPDFL
jgi:hypothetical protein